MAYVKNVLKKPLHPPRLETSLLCPFEFRCEARQPFGKEELEYIRSGVGKDQQNGVVDDDSKGC